MATNPANDIDGCETVYNSGSKPELTGWLIFAGLEPMAMIAISTWIDRTDPAWLIGRTFAEIVREAASDLLK